MLENHYKEDRPWGSFERFTANEPATVKILHVEAGKRFSLQKHMHRAEYWRVIEGSGRATSGDSVRDVVVGDTIEIAIGAMHRLEGGPDGIKVLEIALGNFDEADIERLEDDFGRS